MLIQTARDRWRWQLIKPSYWPLWLGIGLLFLLVQLPYPWLQSLGKLLGRWSIHWAKRRVHIARCNLQLCFPEYSSWQIEQRLIATFESVGMGLLESGMAWFWSDRRVRRWSHLQGLEIIHQLQQSQRNILLVSMHFCTMELCARILGLQCPAVGVYMPHKYPLLEWLQVWGRLRSNKALVDRRSLKAMVRQLKQGEILWYAPDHDYGPRTSAFTPFFAVDKAATTLGTHFLWRQSQAAIMLVIPKRLPQGKGYTVQLLPPLNVAANCEPIELARQLNQKMEQAILQVPEQYLWLHRRFKTRPAGEPSLYHSRNQKRKD